MAIFLNLLAKIIATKSLCVADGATGTDLYRCGLETVNLSELWSIEWPENILWFKNIFFDVGSDLILTSSFGRTSFRLKLHDVQDRVAELNEAAAKLARQAADWYVKSTGRQVDMANWRTY